MAGLVPAIPMMGALCPPDRDRRDKPGDDESGARVLPHLHGTRAVSRPFVLDRVTQDSYSLDFDLADIAVAHPGGRLAGMGDTRRRAGEQEIARLQRHA